MLETLLGVAGASGRRAARIALVRSEPNPPGSERQAAAGRADDAPVPALTPAGTPECQSCETRRAGRQGSGRGSALGGQLLQQPREPAVLEHAPAGLLRR